MKTKRQLRHFIILMTLTFALLGGKNKAFAQEEAVAVDWSGTVTGVTVTSGTTNITLKDDTNLNGWIIVQSSGTVNLDLNGYILKRINANERVAIIQGNGVLNITDSRPSVSHVGSLTTVGNYTKIWQPSGTGVTLTGGIITGGRYDADHAGCISVQNNGTLKIQGGTIAGNVCSTHNGGAVCLFDQSKFEMSGGKICYNGGVSGGGVMSWNGSTSFTMTGGEISYNVAYGGHGGGVYCASTTIDVKKGDFIGNETVYISSGDRGGDGGGFEIESGHTATFGATGAVNIKNNKARIGGGICAEGNASMTLYVNVTIDGNTATLAGGGIRAGDSYAASDTHYVNIAGVTITNNTVNAGGSGGGLHSGYARIRFVGTSDINVYGNKVGSTPSDIYLFPDPSYNPSGSSYYPRDMIEVAVNGIRPVNVGIDKRVFQSGNDQRFFYSGTASYLTNVYNNIKSGTFKVFCNTVRYWKVKPYSSGTYMYFTNPWSSTQQAIAASDESLVSGVYQIGNVKQLTAFLCRVNGIKTNTVDFGTGNVSAKGILTADINMSGHYWVPIGNETAYKGVFDGNGYCIYNLTLEGDNPTNERGMFGQLTTGCEVKNVQLHSYNYTITRTAGAGAGGWGGGIASRLLGGTIHDCVVDGTLTGVAATHMGGLVGTVYSGANVHSCSAMVTLSGSSTMGGLVGNVGGTLKNSFSNPTFTSIGSSPRVGGLAGVNSGTIENCYMRYTPLFAGSNSGTIKYCYGPSGTTTSGTGLSNCGWFTTPVAPYLYTRTNDNMVGNSSLLALLNANRGTGAEWKRTTAGGYSGGGNINGDYPIHKYSQYTCVASTNGKVLDYAKTLDIMLTRHTSNTTVNLYANGTTSKATGSGVVVYIDENISLLQTTSNAITAYTSQTLKSYTRGERWHNISSSLQQSGIGFNYGTTGEVGFSWAENPCSVTFSTTNDNALFPSDVPNINKVDLYTFYEPEYHWLNLKRNTNSHWHMNAHGVKINYIGNGMNTSVAPWSSYSSNGNETILVPGKGYLASIDQEQMLQNKGVLNNGNVVLRNVTKTDNNAWAERLGYNLIGNPYQSYLDFTVFESVNRANLWGSSKAPSEATFAIYDPSLGGYVQYKSGSSRGSRAAERYINMHQGFVIRKTTTDNSTNTNVTFTNAMRTNTAGGGFREDQPAYPLINLMVNDNEGSTDLAILELGRDVNEGAEKLLVNDCKGWLYLHYNNEDYGVLFRDEVEDYQPLWFEAIEAGAYTLTWETANADFEALTLVDNITGTVTDMLARDSYVFEANPDQYASRFKIIIGDFKEIEEYDDPSTDLRTFAFQMGNTLVVNGEGRLEIIDMMGRIMGTEELHGSQSTMPMPQVAAGVYVLRLTDQNRTKTQKIVIE